jgi:hypothetical protein
MTNASLQRLAADWPDWMISRSLNERYWIATYRWHIPVKILLSATTRPDATVIADSAQELADRLRKQPRGIGS